jgi:hypothetical protein
VKSLGAIGAIGHLRVLIDFGVGIAAHKALVQNQAHDNAHRERATTETKDLGVRPMVRAQEFINIQDVSLQAIAENAA